MTSYYHGVPSSQTINDKSDSFICPFDVMQDSEYVGTFVPCENNEDCCVKPRIIRGLK